MLPLPPPRLEPLLRLSRRWTPGAWHLLCPGRTRLSCAAPEPPKLRGACARPPSCLGSRQARGCHAEGRREGAAEEVPESGGASRRGFRGDGGISGQRRGALALLLPLEGAGHSGCSCGAEDPGHPRGKALVFTRTTQPLPNSAPRAAGPPSPTLSPRQPPWGSV